MHLPSASMCLACLPKRPKVYREGAKCFVNLPTANPRNLALLLFKVAKKFKKFVEANFSKENLSGFAVNSWCFVLLLLTLNRYFKL